MLEILSTLLPVETAHRIQMYDRVYSETGTSKIGDTVYQNANGSAPGAVTNIGEGGGDSVGDVPLYSALEPQGSSTPEQEQIPQFENHVCNTSNINNYLL